MQRRLIAGVICGIATIVATAAPAMAAKWAPTEGGVAEVCYQPIGLPAMANQELQAAAATWNMASTNLRVTAGQCSENANIIPLDTGSLGGALGRTSWSGSPMKQAEIRVDTEELQSFGKSPVVAWRGVLCHEMGHSLGLWQNDQDIHTEELTSCMQSHTSKPFPYPTQNDFADLRELYGGQPNGSVEPTTRTPTGATTGRADNGVVFGDPSSGSTAPVVNPAPAPRAQVAPIARKGRILTSQQAAGTAGTLTAPTPISGAASPLSQEKAWAIEKPMTADEVVAAGDFTNSLKAEIKPAPKSGFRLFF